MVLEQNDRCLPYRPKAKDQIAGPSQYMMLLPGAAKMAPPGICRQVSLQGAEQLKKASLSAEIEYSCKRTDDGNECLRTQNKWISAYLDTSLSQYSDTRVSHGYLSTLKHGYLTSISVL